jgi:hypothetical protein
MLLMVPPPSPLPRATALASLISRFVRRRSPSEVAKNAAHKTPEHRFRP